MPPLASLYRVSARPVAPPLPEPADPLAVGQRVAHGFVFGWALLRLVVCAIKGLDVEGFVALVIVVVAVVSFGRSIA